MPPAYVSAGSADHVEQRGREWVRQAAYASGRHTRVPFEHASEGSLGLIPQATGQQCDGCGFVAERGHGDLHPPASEVSHNWLADERGKPCGE